jgi:hypothetical protein
MRTTDLLVVAYLAYVTAVAWIRPLPGRRRAIVTVAAIADAALLAGLARAASPTGLAVRNWMPAAQILVAYWLSGFLFRAPMPRIEAWLARGDRWLFERQRLSRLVDPAPRLVLELLEAAYLGVHVVVPLGFAVALGIDPELDADRYWRVVLAAELGCYALLPWVQTRPPRSLPGDPAGPREDLAVRRLNLAVLRVGSIQVNTVPSGHAAGAIATALVLGRVSPAAGALVAVAALGVIAGSIVGRYHFAIDSLLGAAMGVAAWLLL